MLTGSNAFAMRGTGNKERQKLENDIREASIKFSEYMKSIEWTYDNKAIQLEKNIEMAEYNLYCYEYEDNRRRNWRQ